MNVSKLIEKIIESILNEENYYKYEHLLIVGENNSGKSKILKSVIKGVKSKNVYFIDSCNRKIVTERNNFNTFSDISINDITEKRIEDKYFNKLDVFTDNYGGEIVLNELIDNIEKYNNLFQEILGISACIKENSYQLEQKQGMEGTEINIVDSKNDISVYIDGTELELLSDAQQSMIRILMELNFAYNQGCRMIFIDEFDMNLDHINSADFIEKLKKKYVDAKFIVSAHSLYTVLGANNFDIVKIIKKYEKIEENLFTIFDSNELDNIEIIDKKLFRRNYIENELDIKLSNILKHAILGQDVNIDELGQRSDLSLRQRVIYDFIAERVKR